MAKGSCSRGLRGWVCGFARETGPSVGCSLYFKGSGCLVTRTSFWTKDGGILLSNLLCCSRRSIEETTSLLDVRLIDQIYIINYLPSKQRCYHLATQIGVNPKNQLMLPFPAINQIQINLNSSCAILIKLPMHLKPNPEDNGVISKDFLKKLCKTDFKNYYSTPYLNDILYLHYKGFTKIDNLQEYTGLKVLYMEGNAFRKIEGLENLVNLRCLYLQENMICRIEGLDTLTGLANLNLSDNLIEKVEGLDKLTNLSNLQLKGNRIGGAGLDDVVGLLACPSVSALDISNNKIETEQFFPEVLLKMPNIAVIYMQSNEFTKKISHYRKTIISKIPTIKYIDDKPVFEDELRFSLAWARGGLEEERKERALYKKEKEDAQIKQHEDFRKMIDRFKEEGRREKERAESSQSDSEINSRNQSLSTYKSPQESNENSEKSSEKQSEASSDKHASEKAQSEKTPSEKDKAESDHQVLQKDLEKAEELSVKSQEYKQQQKNKACYLDQLD